MVRQCMRADVVPYVRLQAAKAILALEAGEVSDSLDAELRRLLDKFSDAGPAQA